MTRRFDLLILHLVLNGQVLAEIQTGLQHEIFAEVISVSDLVDRVREIVNLTPGIQGFPLGGCGGEQEVGVFYGCPAEFARTKTCNTLS